jgi:ATP phosphoribosyltransferase regulatory subunit HisZ
LRDVCEDVGKATPPDKIKPYVPAAGFGQEIKEFADTLVGMQEKRHTADYDPSFRAKRSDAEIAVRQSRAAVSRLQNAPVGEREAFLFLLLFRPR